MEASNKKSRSQDIYDETFSADDFNKHFFAIAHNITSDIPTLSTSPVENLSTLPIIPWLKFAPVDEDVVRGCFRRLDDKKATGSDEIPA